MPSASDEKPEPIRAAPPPEVLPGPPPEVLRLLTSPATASAPLAPASLAPAPLAAHPAAGLRPLPPPPSPAEELAAATAALASLGYAYNAEGCLRSLAEGAPFAFRGQAHYERLADAVATYIQALLVSEQALVRRVLPGGVDVFSSPCLGRRAGLLLLLCGAGQVAAGQWARRLCINESLATGSVLPYLAAARAAGLSALVLNPNHARVRSSEAHVGEAWRALVEPAAAGGALRHVAMVAHSFGGVCATALLAADAPPSVLRLLRGVALTDSVHGRSIERCPPASRAFFARHCVNWVTSEEPLDTPVRPAMNAPPQAAAAAGAGSKRKEPPWVPAWCDAARVSAGTRVHESTSEACRPSAIPFLLGQLRRAGWAPEAAEAEAAAGAAEAGAGKAEAGAAEAAAGVKEEGVAAAALAVEPAAEAAEEEEEEAFAELVAAELIAAEPPPAEPSELD